MTPVQPVDSASQSVKPAAQSMKPLHRLEWYPEMPAYPGYKPSGVEWFGDVPEAAAYVSSLDGEWSDTPIPMPTKEPQKSECGHYDCYSEDCNGK